MPFYIDTSAAMKLVTAEAESPVLARWTRSHADNIWSSDLLRTELVRATRRSAPARMNNARSLLGDLHLTTLTTSTYDRAAELDPPVLRTLDALHLASALELGDRLEGIVTYDERLAEAATLHGVAVIAPS